MRRVFSSRGGAAATGSAALALLAAGGSYAIAAGGGRIHGCATKSNGALRVAKKCRKSERTLSWNAQGPAGPRGAQGAQGPQGTPGAQGPSAAYSTGSDGSASTTTTDPLTVSSLSLPAGKYVLSASVRVADLDAASGAGPSCALYRHSTSTLLASTGARLQPFAAGNAWETSLSPVATVVLTSPDAIDLTCHNEDAAASIAYAGWRITAISVASLNGS